MSKRRMSNRELRGLAHERMGRLMSLAVIEAKAGHFERARRLNELARRIALRCNVSMPFGTTVCRECYMPLIPGATSRVRLTSHRVVVQCIGCTSYRRMPYIYEKRVNKKCQQRQEKT
ncbi:MAG TPA: hypothetical protein VLH13_02325 [Methanomassiliicoccales archaeon]|nr:hypothetical protein [Methanomassiliicoccales archaeon]